VADHPTRDSRAALLMLAAICSLQFGSAVARTWFDETGPLGAAALRLVFGAILLVAFTRPRVRTWTRDDWRGAIALGIALGLMNTSIYLAVDRIPFGLAVTIEFLGPLALALGQARRRIDATWALVALAGVALLGGFDTRDLDPLGVAFAVLAAGCWAAYILTTARLARRIAGIEGLAVAACVAALLVLPVGAADAASAVADRHVTLLVFAGIAVLTSALPYSLEYRALRGMSTRLFGIVSSLGPAVAALAGFVVLDQSLHATELLAITLVTVASMGAVAGAGDTVASPPSPPPT
jgi:inner membrane transporter RhtA